MNYVVHFDVCALILTAFSLICVQMKKGIRNHQNQFFVLILISNIFAAFADICSALADMDTASYDVGYLYFVNALYLFFHLMAPPLICYYIYYLYGLRQRKDHSKPFLLAGPYLICVVMILTTRLTHFVFFFDEEGEYTRGNGMILLYLVTLTYLMFAVIVMIRYRRAVSIEKLTMLIVYMILGTVGMIVQFIFQHLLLELFIESVACLGVLFTIENYDEVIDPDTKAFNRNALVSDARKYIVTHVEYSLIVVRVKEAGYIGSTFGVEGIRELEKRIVEYLRSFDIVTVYRYAGGSFALISFDRDNVSMLVDSIAERFESEWQVGSAKVLLGARISCANCPEDIDSDDMLAVMLDAPMDILLVDRHNVDVVLFEDYSREIEIGKALQRAMANKTFEIYYQPICEVNDHKIHAAEALLRLKDEVLGDLGPDEFIPVAEKSGYINEIGEYVTEAVCAFYRDNDLGRLGIDFIDINLSVLQCMSEGFVGRIRDIVRRSGIEPRHINLEVTESSLVRNKEVMHKVIDEFEKEGIRFSLDDFGTGYSNFSYILDYPFHIIKIDKSLLWSANAAENGSRVFEGMMSMFRSMNVKTLVEGVETDSHRYLVETNGCDYIQGFYYSEPVCATEFIEYISKINS